MTPQIPSREVRIMLIRLTKSKRNEPPNKKLPVSQVEKPTHQWRSERLPRQAERSRMSVDLRQNSTRCIDNSKKLIEKSRRAIFKTELSLTKDD